MVKEECECHLARLFARTRAVTVKPKTFCRRYVITV
jgi:hypothetical protein